MNKFAKIAPWALAIGMCARANRGCSRAKLANLGEIDWEKWGAFLLLAVGFWFLNGWLLTSANRAKADREAAEKLAAQKKTRKRKPNPNYRPTLTLNLSTGTDNYRPTFELDRDGDPIPKGEEQQLYSKRTIPSRNFT